MAEFCLNTLCLKYNELSEKGCIQELLDKTLIFITETWAKHKKLTQRDLRLYVDVNPNQQGLFNYKEYQKELLSRSRFGYSKLRNLARALATIQVHAPFYVDPGYTDACLDDLSDKKISVQYNENYVTDCQIVNYDPDAIILYFADQRQMNLLSLANRNFWKNDAIAFVVEEKNGTCVSRTIGNTCLHDDNEFDVERSFFPYSVFDEAYFVRTGRKSQGQEIFREINSGRYWCLDNLHKNHFEVYSSTYEHLGEADLATYVLDTGKMVPGRNIKSEFS